MKIESSSSKRTNQSKTVPALIIITLVVIISWLVSTAFNTDSSLTNKQASNSERGLPGSEERAKNRQSVVDDYAPKYKSNI